MWRVCSFGVFAVFCFLHAPFSSMSWSATDFSVFVAESALALSKYSFRGKQQFDDPVDSNSSMLTNMDIKKFCFFALFSYDSLGSDSANAAR